jgi:serine/threonine protein kinase/tetratricopeptide (TPR) repeat protein
MTIAPGEQFGPYRILEKIGSGGMGEVYRAQDTRLDREVAIKLVSDVFLADGFSGSPSPGASSAKSSSPGTVSHRRFLREAQAASALNHPNICTIHDIGEQNGRPYLVMELLRGETLKQLLHKGTVSVTEIVTFSRQIAGALEAAHGHGIVHRDIKPANLFVVGPAGKQQIKILDFGLAKRHDAADVATSGDATAMFAGDTNADRTTDLALTNAGSTLGTVAYMSPEQAEGQPLDARTDLFSLGSVMYEMTTGKTPFAGGSAAGIFAALLTKDPQPVSEVRAAAGLPAMPDGFDAIVAKLLAKDRTKRYQSAADVEGDLEELGNPGVSPSHPTHDESVRGMGHPNSSRVGLSKRRRIFVIVATCCAVIAAGTVLFLKNHTGNAKPAGASAPTVTATAQKDALIVSDFSNKTGDPVFDTTLNQALTVQLEQSPVLSLVSSEHLRKSLAYLGKPEDAAITPEIAREIGEREGDKAVLAGAIASLGKTYVITLTAQNSATGDEIATTQATAADKEHVLDAVNTAGAAMRAKLGESLASIQKLNDPFGEATTPNIEAFRLYALGNQEKLRGHEIPEAADFYKQALALDPKLAVAWGRLGGIYDNAFMWEKGDDALNRAYQLRDHVSEREKEYITELYLENNLGDFADDEPLMIQAEQLYPQDEYTHIHLGNAYMWTGEFEKAMPEYQAAMAIQPDDAIPLEDALWAYGVIGQLDKMREILARLDALHMDGTGVLAAEVQAYGLLGDQKKIDAMAAQVAGRPDEFFFLNNLAFVENMGGHIQQSVATFSRAAQLAHEQHAPEVEAEFMVTGSVMTLFTTGCPNMEAIGKQALALDRSRVILDGAGGMMAFCGFKSGLQVLAEAQRKFPKDTMLVNEWIPEAKAMLLLKDNKPKEALVELEKGRKYENQTAGAYIRGTAYLQLKDAQNAIAAFKDATKYRGAGFFAYYYEFPYAQSWLGMGRAYVMAGDKADAKKCYDRFFVEWKDADPDIPDLIAAKKEYAAL